MIAFPARALSLLVVVLLAPPAQAQTLTKVQVVRMGKKATALVESQAGKISGSAFCIHSSGLFLTNEHVVRGGEAISLVVNSGLKTQKVLKARVVRTDAALDLALLRADGDGSFPALAWGRRRSWTS